MRRSREGEFAKGVNSGMRKTFFRCTYLPTLEAAEAYKLIAIEAAGKKMNYGANIRARNVSKTCKTLSFVANSKAKWLGAMKKLTTWRKWQDLML